jgi:CBS domain-containing protein
MVNTAYGVNYEDIPAALVTPEIRRSLMNVKSAMVNNVLSCHADTTLDSIALMMWDNDCGSLPVVDDDNKPVGIITDRDIAIGSALQHRPLWEITAESVCGNRDLYCCKSTDDIHKALDMMRDHAVRRLPVVNSKGKLVGIVSLGDLVACTDAAKGAGFPFGEMAGMLSAVSSHHTQPKLTATA